MLYTIGRHRSNPLLYTIQKGDFVENYKHPASPYSFICCSKNLFGGANVPSLDFPITISLDHPPNQTDLQDVVEKCQQLRNLTANVSDEPLVLKEHGHSGTLWYEVPLETKRKSIPVNIATDKKNHVWIVDRTIKEDSLYSPLSNVKCLNSNHRITEEDWNWLQTQGFPNQEMPWCISCLKNLDGISEHFKEKLYNICITAEARRSKPLKLLFNDILVPE